MAKGCTEAFSSLVTLVRSRGQICMRATSLSSPLAAQELTNEDPVELEVQPQDEGSREEDGAGEPEGSTAQHMVRGCLYLKTHCYLLKHPNIDRHTKLQQPFRMPRRAAEPPG